MAKRKSASRVPAARDPMARLTDLAALLLVKGESQPDKIRTLSAVGYSPAEIANLLGITANAVSIALHRLRSRG